MQELIPQEEGDGEEGGGFTKNDKANEYISKINDDINIE